MRTLIASLLVLSGCDASCVQLPTVQRINASASGPRGLLSLNPTWPMHVIDDGTNCNGADGTALLVVGSDVLVAVSCEQGSVVRLATLSAGAWSVVGMGTSSSVEDAQLADIDGQGTTDLVSFNQNRDIRLHFGEVGPSDLTLTNAHGDQIWQAGAIVDMDGDDDLDIVGGGRNGAFPAAHLKWFENPGGLDARSNGPAPGDFWVEHDIDVAGYTMNLFALDVDGDADIDVVCSDRDGYWTGVGTKDNSLKGSRWLENDGAGTFTRHQISTPVAGEPKMVSLADFDGDGDLDVLDGSSGAAPGDANYSYIHYNLGSFAEWATVQVNQPSGVGQYHDAEAADIDGDGLTDIVFTYSDAYTAGLSGVIWVSQAGGWLRGEISGNDGDKYDNATIYDVDGDGDPDVITTEQHETVPPSANTGADGPGLGLVWYENPRLP